MDCKGCKGEESVHTNGFAVWLHETDMDVTARLRRLNSNLTRPTTLTTDTCVWATDVNTDRIFDTGNTITGKHNTHVSNQRCKGHGQHDTYANNAF